MNTSSMTSAYARTTNMERACAWEGAWIVRAGLGQFWFLWCLDELFWGSEERTMGNHVRDDEGV
jgi:hypothetical protein